MFEARASETTNMTLEAVVERLQASRLVESVVLIGSTAGGVNQDSDYDLLIVLAQHPPARYGSTWIEHRLTDLIFVSLAEIEDLTESQELEIPPDEGRAQLAWHLSKGKVSFDRHGRVREVQVRLQASPLEVTVEEEERFRRWDHANYNLAQSRRYATSANPLYQEAFELRMTYQLAEAMIDYFYVRGMPWPGEKTALTYWASEDPVMKALFLDCVREPDPPSKFDKYSKLLQHSLEPAGGLWSANSTSNSPAVAELWGSIVRDR